MIPLENIVYVGLNGKVAALEKSTGDLVWEWNCPKPRRGTVMLMAEKDCIVAAVSGYIYGLDPLSGDQLWHNPLKGWGTGITTLTSINQGANNAMMMAVAQAQAAAEQAAAAAAGAAGAAGS